MVLRIGSITFGKKKEPKPLGEIFLKPGEIPGTTPGITYTTPAIPGQGGTAGAVAREVIPSGVVKVSSGGGGGGGVSIPTPSIPTPEPAKEWSGKVEEISPKGEVVSTKYYVKEKEVGEIRGGYAYVPPTVGGAVLEFGEREKVIVGKEGIGMEWYEPAGSEIFIGGLGYSVAEGKQQEFIESMLGKPTTTEKYYTVLEAPLPIDRSFRNIFGLGTDIKEFEQRMSTAYLRERDPFAKQWKAGALFGAGVLGVGIGTAEALIHPLQTIKRIYTKAGEFIVSPLGAITKGGASIGTQLRVNPAGIVGKGVGYYLTGMGLGKIVTLGFKTTKGAIVGNLGTLKKAYGGDIIKGVRLEVEIPKTPLGKTFAKDIVVWGEKDILGKEFVPYKMPGVSKIALQKLKAKPIEFGFEPTAEMRNIMNRLRSEADFIKIDKKGGFKIVEAKLPKITEAKPIEFGFEPTAEMRNMINRFRSEADYLKLEKGGWKIKPTKESKVSYKPTTPITFELDTSMLRSQINRLRSGADFMKLEKGGWKIKPTKESKPSYKPITFEIDTSALRNQMNRLRSGADLIAISKKGRINIREMMPRLRKKPRGRPLFEPYKPIQFDVQFDKDMMAKAVGGRQQQQLLLVKPKMADLGKQVKVRLKLKTEPRYKQYQVQVSKEVSPLRSIQQQISRQLSKSILAPALSLRQGAGQIQLQLQLPAQAQVFGQKQIFKQQYKTMQVQVQSMAGLSTKMVQRQLYVQKPAQFLRLWTRLKTPIKPFILPIPKMEIEKTMMDMFAGRKFQRTPSLGVVIKQVEFGIKTPKLAEKFEVTGLYERGGRIPKAMAMPITYLKEVKFVKQRRK